ncbi:phosphoribosyltransferase [Hahella sp. CCB-MM4]|uniref:phosphoribosyltransferase n=1 Tax=Hahella sp. (strain CCB-MM4) TaxID=1926491 RepID=UPI000B9A4F1D|nr:phosphoribosyltransferase [Hahella sp. CCB-MM4]OZG69777.1 phosphoribosyltransferase [Hahella sp. CCB-MM4]
MRSFTDRKEAGELLAQAINEHLSQMHQLAPENPNILVLALPRGGVPVAAPVAQKLGAELDLMIVRKLGLPWHPELAMGAITTGDIRILNDDVISMNGVTDNEIEQVEQREKLELARRESAYRQDRPLPSIQDRTIILVDDGIATGATMLAAIEGVRRQHPKEILVGTPVAPAVVVEDLKRKVDAVICLSTPIDFYAIGRWYNDFSQTTDEEVHQLLGEAWHT